LKFERGLVDVEKWIDVVDPKNNEMHEPGLSL